MAFVCFISPAYHRNMVCYVAIAVQNIRKRECPYMTSGIGPKCNTVHKWKLKPSGEQIQITQPKQDIGFLIAGHIFRNKVIIPQIALCRF